MPALKAGLLAAAPSLAGQGPPSGEAVIWKESEGWASAPSGALHGVRSELVVWVAQVGGVISEALAPEKRCRLHVFERELGVFRKAGGELTGVGVGFDPPGELCDRARVGVFEHEVDRQQRAELVFVGLGEVDRA